MSENSRKSGKKRKTEDERPFASSKTPQVMKLVSDDRPVNPVVIAGKSRIPKQLRGIEPLSRIMRRDSEALLGVDKEEAAEPMVTINLTEAVIRDNVSATLRRFNACGCGRCVEALTKIVSEDVPARFVDVPQSTANEPSKCVPEQYEPIKREVLAKMIRILMGNKKRSFHE